jgi:hypothetical protein
MAIQSWGTPNQYPIGRLLGMTSRWQHGNNLLECILLVVYVNNECFHYFSPR